MCVYVCVCDDVRVGLWAGNRRCAGEGVADEGAPHENWRNSLATEERINTKWGAPIHPAPSSEGAK